MKLPSRPAAMLLLGALTLPCALAAQKHAVTDQSLASSLLAASVPFPSAPQRLWADSLDSTERVRFEFGYSRLVLGGAASPLMIGGIRWDHPQRDSTGHSAAVVGLRFGFQPMEEAREGRFPAAVELHAGARSLGFVEGSRRPDVGFDIVVGWSNLGERTNGSLGLRFPVEVTRRNGWGRLTFGVVPTVAWGHIRFRSCEDRGRGDNCGDLGIQLEFGRTRFLLAGGMSVGLDPAGLAISVGTQQLLAAGQDPRLALGLSWTPF
jgi:hypothetical protein